MSLSGGGRESYRHASGKSCWRGSPQRSQRKEFLEERFGWQWAFTFLALWLALGVLAMLRLKSLLEAAQIAGGHG